jgi:hypothetical protein
MPIWYDRACLFDADVDQAEVRREGEVGELKEALGREQARSRDREARIQVLEEALEVRSKCTRLDNRREGDGKTVGTFISEGLCMRTRPGTCRYT